MTVHIPNTYTNPKCQQTAKFVSHNPKSKLKYSLTELEDGIIYPMNSPFFIGWRNPIKHWASAHITVANHKIDRKDVRTRTYVIFIMMNDAIMFIMMNDAISCGHRT